MQHFLVLSWASEATLRHWGNVYKLYRLYVFLREGHRFVLYALNGEATLWHKLQKLYSFFALDQQTNKCSSNSQTMLKVVCGCILECNLWLAGPADVIFGLHCFIAELNTHTVRECNALEWNNIQSLAVCLLACLFSFSNQNKVVIPSTVCKHCSTGTLPF